MVIIDNNNIIPLIIDLNHCIYNTKINYDKNIGKSYKWDFKSSQEDIKDKLLK